MKSISSSFFLFAICSLGSLRASDADAFYAAYEPKHQQLVSHLWRNIRVAGNAKIYDNMPLGKYLGNHVFQIVATETHLLYRSKTSSVDKVKDYIEGVVISPDDSYEISGDKDAKKFTISSHIYPWGKELWSEAWIGKYSRVNIARPFFELRLPGGQNDYFMKKRRTDLGDCKITNVQYRNVPAIQIEISREIDGHPIVVTVTLDAKGYYVLEERSNYNFNFEKKKYVPTPVITEVSYSPVNEGLPFPKSIKSWIVEAGGKRIPQTDVEYTEYKRYTPTPDEVDMEKQFGISPLPLPPRPELPAAARGATPGTKIARWLYGFAALFAILTATIVVRARRRARITTMK